MDKMNERTDDRAANAAMRDHNKCINPRLKEEEEEEDKVARWQNLIPSFPWDCARVEGVAHNPRKGRDQIL